MSEQEKIAVVGETGPEFIGTYNGSLLRMYEAYAVAIGAGIMTVDEVREKLGLQPFLAKPEQDAK
jgi:hypothetical protein